MTKSLLKGKLFKRGEELAYKIVEYNLDHGLPMRVLVEEGKCSFIEDLANDKKTRQRAAVIVRTAYRIEEQGVDWARVTKKLKLLDFDCVLFELRINKQVIRVMTYLPSFEDRPVYLFSFTGHQGKTSKIKKADLDKAKRLCKIAASLIEGADNEHE